MHKIIMLCVFIVYIFAMGPVLGSDEDDNRMTIPLKNTVHDLVTDTWLLRLAQSTGADLKLFQTDPVSFAKALYPSYRPEDFPRLTPQGFIYGWLTHRLFLTLKERAYRVAVAHHMDVPFHIKDSMGTAEATPMSLAPWIRRQGLEPERFSYHPHHDAPLFACFVAHYNDFQAHKAFPQAWQDLPLVHHVALSLDTPFPAKIESLSRATNLQTLDLEDVTFEPTVTTKDGRTRAHQAFFTLMGLLPTFPCLKTLTLQLPSTSAQRYLRSSLQKCPELSCLVMAGSLEEVGHFFADLSMVRPCGFFARIAGDEALCYDTQNKCFSAPALSPLRRGKITWEHMCSFTRTLMEQDLPKGWRCGLPEDLRDLPYMFYPTAQEEATHDIFTHTLTSGEKVALGRRRDSMDVDMYPEP